MQTDNPFAAPDAMDDAALAVQRIQLAPTTRITAPRWWICTWLGTAVAGSGYGIVVGLSVSVGASLFFAVFGFLYAFAAGFLTSSTGLLPLLLFRSRVAGRWFPLLLSIVCGGLSGQLCIDWTAGCTGAVVAGITLLCFGWPRHDITTTEPRP
ncbi:MAG: hypothetical protein ACKO2P_08945 [Planctomycetota bacterium]